MRPAQSVATLLIVDQLEELLIQTPPALAAPFAQLMLALADGDKDIRILLTVRADYFNLIKAIKDDAGKTVEGADGESLFERLNVNDRAAILPLKRISEQGLSDAIRKPLRLAGDADEAAHDALVLAVKRDISDQPSDLPLLQVALRAAWGEHKTRGIGLVRAYESVGGVLGALANEAEAARNRLEAEDQARLESVFVRLVRLGDTGGATRRTAVLDEFDGPRQALLRRLADDKYGRLVVVGESSAEIAHEALITQWPWLAVQLNANAIDVRRLNRLIARSGEWSKATQTRKSDYLAAGAERDIFDDLRRRYGEWLSREDRAFVEASNRRERFAAFLRWSAVTALAAAFVIAATLGFLANRARVDLANEVNVADRNLSVALTALRRVEAGRRPINAATFALAAGPRDVDDFASKPDAALDLLEQVVPQLRERLRIPSGGTFAFFSPDGTRILTAPGDATARDLGRADQGADRDPEGARQDDHVRRIQP